jgi:hypothetical protein
LALADLDIHTVGKKDGEVLMIKNNGKVEAYQVRKSAFRFIAVLTLKSYSGRLLGPLGSRLVK